MTYFWYWPCFIMILEDREEKEDSEEKLFGEAQ